MKPAKRVQDCDGFLPLNSDNGPAKRPRSPGLSSSAPHEVTSVTIGRLAADKANMTSSVAEVFAVEAPAEYRTTWAPCLICVTTLSLDNDQPKTGKVRWKVVPNVRLQIGIAVSFECPQGHSSEADPQLLTAFPPRRFWWHDATGAPSSG